LDGNAGNREKGTTEELKRERERQKKRKMCEKNGIKK
jgi:hypothetical protein